MNSPIESIQTNETCRWTDYNNPEVNPCICGSSAYVDFRNRNFLIRFLSPFQIKFNYFVVCSNKACNNISHACSSRALAILHWNISSDSQYPNKLELPLFRIDQLEESEIMHILIEEKSEILTNLHSLKKGIFRGFFNPSKLTNELSLRLAWIEYGLAFMTEHPLGVSSIEPEPSLSVPVGSVNY